MSSSKTFLRILLLSVMSLPIVVPEEVSHTTVPVKNMSTYASLAQTPQEVKSWQPALIFAYVQGGFSTIELHVTVTISLFRDDVGIEGFPRIGEAKLCLVPVPSSPGWYFIQVPGLPARTVVVQRPVRNIIWKVGSTVSYKLLVDGVERASGSYVVQEGEAGDKFPPLVTASVYEVIEDPSILSETFGLGPKGWRLGAFKPQKILVVVVDDEEIGSQKLEYATSDGNWKETSLTEDPTMDPLDGLLDDLESIIKEVNTVFPEALPMPRKSMGTYDAELPGQPAGMYIKFVASANDIDGNTATSPIGFYFVVNDVSSTRILVVDPHVELWLLEENLEELLSSLKINSDYQVPSSIIENMTLLAKIAETTKKFYVAPFHHWEMLAKHYDLYVAQPDEKLAQLLKTRAEGGFEPNVTVLSNLCLGISAEGSVPWNWDLNDIEVNDTTAQEILIEYTKKHHAGLIATRGTLSDWIVWLGPDPDQHYKIGARGHVGNNMDDLDVLDEKTVASTLGMPQLALWEYIRDRIAQVLATNPETEPFGLAVGSLPLQIPIVPLNSSLEATAIGVDHPILEGVNSPFDLPIPSVYSKFNYSSCTQVGWQLAMARQIAYDAWTKSNGTLPLMDETLNRFTQLLENITNTAISDESSSRVRDSLRWALREFYQSVIAANMSSKTFNASLDFHELGLVQPIHLSLDVNFTKLLQLLPVKLIACSQNYTAGIVAYDKYWDEKGYRSVYFSVEPEACNENIAWTLLKNAVDWTLDWSYTEITTLLGQTRVPNDLARSLQNVVNGLNGSAMFSASTVLIEEGQTFVEINATTPATIYLLMAHPTCKEVDINLTGGNGQIREAVNISEGLTKATIRTYEAGTMEIGVSAIEADSSLNPAYIAAYRKG